MSRGGIIFSYNLRSSCGYRNKYYDFCPRELENLKIGDITFMYRVRSFVMLSEGY